LKNILVDHYRPRILENFVYDLLEMATNDRDSEYTFDQRLQRKTSLIELPQMLEESYNAVIYRFDRSVLAMVEKTIKSRDHGYVQKMIQLLFSSMLSTSHSPVYFSLQENDVLYFTEMIASIYPVKSVADYVVGYSLYEGYVISGLLKRFDDEIKQFNLSGSLDLLNKIISSEGKKSSAKGVAFETVCLNELTNPNKMWSVRTFCDALGVSLQKVNSNIQCLDFPIEFCHQSIDEDIYLIDRPRKWLRPSNAMRPDVIAFLGQDKMITVGIKLYTSEVSRKVFDDNLMTTAPSHFYTSKNNSVSKKRKAWIDCLGNDPIHFTLRILFVFPRPASFILPENTSSVVHVLVTLDNMDKVFSQDTCTLLRFICSGV
jgi:hypothetical protein